jgi:endonuclease/exonuclease/phosphatase family metal-dependent hydrolase
VVTINLKQRRTLDVERFTRLFEAAASIRSRVPAFNGGFSGAVMAPDVIVMQETTQSNAEIFRRLVNQRFGSRYDLLGPPESRAKFLYNSDALSLVGDVVTWSDACLDGLPPGEKERTYQRARFSEVATGRLFTVAGVHFEPQYPKHTQQPDCYMSNINLLRAQVEGEPGPVILAGDFNRRSVNTKYECDPDERSSATTWWARLTSPSLGERIYGDAVRNRRRAQGLSMASEWTHEQKGRNELCNGARGIRRTRIDYVFVSGATIAEARTDSPGWATSKPGAYSEINKRYSDHRFVWTRLVLSGPPRIERPAATALAGGDIDLTWQPSEGAAKYVVYRALGNRKYDELAIVDANQTSFRDIFTEHGRIYRYAVASVGSDGGFGLESAGVRAEADARGPRVTVVRPADDELNVRRNVIVEVRFDERIDSQSVTGQSVRLFRKGRSIPGRLVQVAPRVLVLKPSGLLGKKKTYNIVVRPLRDKLGNAGPREAYWFRTR